MGMSELTEQDQFIQRPRPGTVPLSVLIEFICQKVYTDLMRLVDLLRDKTDLEKKIEIATFFSRTRHLFIRLEALVKWSSSASKVDKCEKISNFLEEQSFFLINSANVLSRLVRETLVGARLPPFGVLLAIDIFTNRGYTRLPKSIKSCVNPMEPISDRTLNEALLDLNRIIQNRLSLTQLPRQFKHINISNGRVQFIVPNEFEVTLTMMSEALDFPWRVLNLKFLIRDALTRDSNLVHPLQAQFIQNQVQSRLLYRNFDKRPPLIHLYDMLHAFSMSLQLDVLHEQAQRIRSKRSTDQLSVEAYRPGQNLVISYWHSLSRSQFHAQLGLDGKLMPTAYLISIYVDPTDLQRPLCVNHHPQLSENEAHRIGVTLQGSNLSFEDLMSRTILARAEHILQQLRQEFMILSPGPVQVTDSPLCLTVPLLWPCHPQELLQIRVDPVHGTLVANCAGLLIPEMEELLVGTNWDRSGMTGIADGFCAASVCAALSAIESSLNRPSSSRVNPVVSATSQTSSTTGEPTLLVAQARTLRTLSSTESRWRSTICQSLEHLRICLALVRLIREAKQHRPFWQPVKRSLPLVLTSSQASIAMNSTNWPSHLVRFQQSTQWPIVFIQLLPNNQHYLVCEVLPASLDVTYRYFSLSCSAIPDQMSVHVNPNGLLVVSCDSTSVSGTGLQSPGRGLFLQVTHFAPIDIDAVWFNLPSSSLSMLRSCAERVKEKLVKKRQSRVVQLLSRKTQRETEQETSCVLTSDRPSVPGLVRLLGMMEENVLVHCLALELSRAGVIHDGIQFDADGCLTSLEIFSIPTHPLPWQPSDLKPLCQYVQRIVLRPHFDQFTHRRSWQLDLLFKGLVPTLSGRQVCSEQLRHQTAEWSVARLEDFPVLVKNLLAQWDSLCHMHALCYQIVNNPDQHLPPDVRPQSYNLKTLSLVYSSNYIVEVTYRSESGFAISLGFIPNEESSGPLVDRVDSNPHMVVRHHLEELLNSCNSLTVFAKTLLYTLPFMSAIEPLRDRTLSNHGLKTPASLNCLRSVRGMVLIALSLYDLVLIYRASLCMRITLSPLQPHPFNFIGSEMPLSASVQLSDASSQFADAMLDRTTRPNGDSLLAGVVPLPAFQRGLWKSLEDALHNATKGDTWTGLTLPQLAQFVQPKAQGETKPTFLLSRSRYSLSPLESYLSTSLLFHACISAVGSLDCPIIPSDSSDTTDASRLAEVISSGAFEAHWPSSCLTSHVRMIQLGVQTKEVLGSNWKLSLRLTSTVSTVDHWSQETLALMEEFFETRVCAAPYQPSAVAAFFRLLALPVHACQSIVRLFPFDLHPPAHVPVLLRVGLVGLGSNKRIGNQGIGNRTMTNSPHGGVGGALDPIGGATPELIPGLPGILVRPPRITLQLLVMRTQRAQMSKFSNTPMAQLILVGYDWEVNRVAILTNTTTPGPSKTSASRTDSVPTLPQLLIEADVEANANMMASNSGDSALVHLAMLITQTSPAVTSYPNPPSMMASQPKPTYGGP